MVPTATAIRPRYPFGRVAHRKAHLPDQEGDDKRCGAKVRSAPKHRLSFTLLFYLKICFFACLTG